MAITLPSTAVPNGATPLLRNWGGVLEPFLGGPEQIINRLGTRFGIRATMPPMESADTARIVVSRLLQAKTSRLLMDWPLLDFDPGSPGAPKISAATASGSTIPIKGMNAGYQGKEGQFFSIVHNSRRYLHMFTADFTASGTGTATATIFPMLRINLATDDVLEIAQPKIEGNVLPGDELNWTMALAGLIDTSFSVMEAA